MNLSDEEMAAMNRSNEAFLAMKWNDPTLTKWSDEELAAMKKEGVDWETALPLAAMQSDIAMFERGKLMVEKAAIEGTGLERNLALERIEPERAMQVDLLPTCSTRTTTAS